MKSYLRCILLLAFLFIGRSSFAQISCQIQWYSDSIGCGNSPGSINPLTLLLRETDNSPNSPITKRVWTLYHCGNSDSISVQYSGLSYTSFSQTIDTPGCYCIKFWVQNQAGQADSVVDCNIKVSPSPIVGALFSDTEGCIPFTTQILCNSIAEAGTINSFIVQFNPGSVTETDCPPGAVAYTFPPGSQPGWVNAVVGVTNTDGCGAHITYDSVIHLIPTPVASFTQDTANAECAHGPLQVCFHADSTDPHLTYCWYINNTLIQCSDSQNFCHTFPLSDSCYNVGLTVHHPSGCGDSIIIHNDVCVSTKPIITWTQNSGDSVCAPGCITFTNTSPTISTLKWILCCPPDTITGPSATFCFPNPGVYTLTISGTFALGCVRDTTITIHVFSTPIANFTVSDTFSCSPPDTAVFIATPCAGCTYLWPNIGNLTGDTAVATFTSCHPYTVNLTVSNKYGNLTCNSSVSKANIVNVVCLNPQISSTGYKGCLPECFTLNDATVLTGFPPSVSIASACWSFPGSTLAGACQDTLQRCITVPGCNTVQLQVTTSNGCTQNVTLPDTLCGAAPPNNCTLTATPDTMCFEQDTVKFTVKCDSLGYVRVNFGDAAPPVWVTYNTGTFTHIYEDTGLILTTVITYKDSCAGDTLTKTVLINPPIAKFIDSFSCASKDTIYFNNQSMGATSYLWQFCYGDTSTLARPYLVLPYCDTCSATLTAYNSRTGCVHHKTLAFNTACDSSSFTPVDTSVCVNTNVVFTNTSINSTHVGWSWNCSTISATGNSQSHQFNAPGVYCVFMQNTNSGGCIDTVYGTITVCNVSAGFTYNPVCFPAPICFHDTATTYCTPVVWNWHFGDDSVATGQNVCHVYTNPGTYNVSLAVYSGACSDSITMPISTSNIVSVNYNVDTIVCPGHQSCVTNTSTGNNLTYEWVMPGASPNDSSTSATPCFTYNTPGNYQIYLQLSSNHQCSIFDTITVHAFAPVSGGYLDTDFLACPVPYHVIQFTDTSKYVNGTYSWTFGDGYGSTAVSTGHVYDHPGIYVVTLTTTDKQGCSSTVTIDTVTVLGPYGTFVEAPLPGICACKDSMSFTVATYDATKVTDVFGCNTGFAQDTILTVGTQANPTIYTFTIPYCLRDSCLPLIIYGDNNQCLVTDSLPWFYVDSPSVGFTFDNFGVCYAGTVCFHDTSRYHLLPYQSYTVSRLWNFGDGSTDTSANPCHYYAQPGGYIVTLYIHSNLGCFDSSINTLVVVPKYPIAGYYASDSFVCANTAVCFYDTSTIYPLTHAWFRIWNFGDGTPVDTVYSDTVCHVYTTGGFYRVNMCVYDSIGCSDCDSSTLMHVITNPVAHAGGNQTLCYGAVAQLSGSGGVSYMWQPAGLFSNPDTAFPSVQLFQDTTVELIVSNIYGCADTDTVVLTVARVFAGFISNATVCRGDSLCVIDSSTSINDQLVQWQYNFGDSSILSGKNVCHRYSLSGNYNISHIVTDNHGCMDTAIKNITVFPSPAAAFTLSDTVICSNQPLCFTDQSASTTPILNWYWNFDDGSTSGDSSPPCHLFNPPYMSPYRIMLVVTDQNSCTDTALENVTVHVRPNADFSWNPSCEDTTMPLSSSLSSPGQPTNSPIGYCQWTFWLGAPSPVIDSNCFTSFKFPPGTHNVQLVVTDLNGCRDTVVEAVVTDSLSQLIIYPGDTTICLGTSVDYSVQGVFTQITWAPDTWISNPNAPVVTINPLAGITYQVSAMNGVCQPASDTFTIQVLQPQYIEATDSPQTIFLGLSSYLNAIIADGEKIDSIAWSPDSTLDCRNCYAPVATPIQTTTYTATIYYSLNGITCNTSVSVTVNVITMCNGALIYLPNTFTPNGDGKNDVFRIRSPASNAVIKEFRIFDRWGRVVFEESDAPLNDAAYGWNGDDMTGKKLNPDVYVYTYQIQCSDGNIVTGSGNVTLLR